MAGIADFCTPDPHADKPRRYRIGRWATDQRLARGWVHCEVAARLRSRFRSLGNQGRISELETGNGVQRKQWTPEVIGFLHELFAGAPPPAEDEWWAETGEG